jgi:hypothetical protein
MKELFHYIYLYLFKVSDVKTSLLTVLFGQLLATHPQDTCINYAERHADYASQRILQ